MYNSSSSLSFFCSLSLYSVYISYLKSQSIFHMYIGQCSSVKKLIRGLEWSSNNDISLLHQGIPFMDHAHMYGLKVDTVTFIFQSGKRTSEDSLLLPVPKHFAQISLLEILIPALQCHCLWEHAPLAQWKTSKLRFNDWERNAVNWQPAVLANS